MLYFSGVMICFGESEYFRYNHPNEVMTEDPDDIEENTISDDIIISNTDNSELEKSINSTTSTSSLKSLNISLTSNEKTSEDMSENMNFNDVPDQQQQHQLLHLQQRLNNDSGAYLYF